MERPLHREAAVIRSRLQRERITAFYHFTCLKNLPNICRTQSLYSKQTLEDMGMWPPSVPGGNAQSHNLDRARGNWNKVSLSLTPHTPMAYHIKRVQHLCFLVIDPIVATWSGVMFTDSNAAGTIQRRGEGITGLSYINFEAIRAIPRPWDRQGWVGPVQAEALVPDSIPFKYVSKIAFVSKASMAYAEQLCGSQPQFSVDQRLFFDSPLPIQKVPDFSHLIDLVLTYEKIDQNTMHLPHLHKKQYYRSGNGQVTLIASVKAMAGMQAEIRWLPSNITSAVQFQTSSQYRHRTHILLSKLPDGVCTVEYYLNNECWTSTDFEILG